jgi:hypothetical protein
MTKDEALKLALEALEIMTQPVKTNDETTKYKAVTKAITALREALAKPDFWEGYEPEPVKPAQQEPAASVPIHPKTGPLWAMTTDKPDPERLPSYPLMRLYTTPPAAQPATEESSATQPDYAWPTVDDYEKDVGFQVGEAFKMAWNMARTTNGFLKLLSSEAPPPAAKRTWVELSSEDKKIIRNNVGYDQFMTAGEYAHLVQEATEIKLKELNT